MQTLPNSDILILEHPSAEFPMLMAASAVYKRCGTCNHANISPQTSLAVAVTMYKDKDNFKSYVKKLFKRLPIMLAGIEVTE